MIDPSRVSSASKTRHLLEMLAKFVINCCVIISVSLVWRFSFQDYVARYKPTTQSSTKWPYYPDYAVDGVKGTNLLRDKCSCTNAAGSTNPWWRVDLEELLPVSEVYILNRGDCCGDRLKGFEIRVGKYSLESDENVCCHLLKTVEFWTFQLKYSNILPHSVRWTRWWYKYVNDSHVCLSKAHHQEFYEHHNSDLSATRQIRSGRGEKKKD